MSDLTNFVNIDGDKLTGNIATLVRRQGFWDNMRFELAEALAHQGCHFMLPLLDEASGAV